MSEKEKESGNLKESEKSSLLQDPAPTVVEWSVRGISLVLIIGLIVFFTVQAFSPVEQTKFNYEIIDKDIAQVGNSWHMPVKITNQGSKSIHELTLDAILEYSEKNKSVSEKVSFSIRLFGPGETRKAIFVFNKDPRQHEITFDVASYEMP